MPSTPVKLNHPKCLSKTNVGAIRRQNLPNTRNPTIQKAAINPPIGGIPTIDSLDRSFTRCGVVSHLRAIFNQKRLQAADSRILRGQLSSVGESVPNHSNVSVGFFVPSLGDAHVISLELLIPTLVQSGAEKQLVQLATGLPRDEFDVRVTCLTAGGPYEERLRAANIPVAILGKRFQFDPFAFIWLRQHLQARQPDILHTWLFAANSYGRLAVPRGASTRVIVSERCVDSWKSWQLRVDRRLVGRTDCLVGNSQAVVDFYRPLGYPESKLRVIPNGVEIPRPPAQSREAFLRELKIPADAQVVMAVGRLAPQKRVADLVWSAQLLRQADPRAYLVIVGDGPLRSSLEQYAREVEVTSHVRFLGHRTDAASLLHHADLVWLGSEFEGMSNSLMEAMACGRPIVATAIPPNQELIQHGVHGYLVDIGDSAGFAQFSLKLMKEPELAARLGDAARQKVEAELSVPRMIERHVALYREIMSQPPLR